MTQDLVPRWVESMRAQGNSPRTIEDWPRVIRLATRHTGEDPAAFTASGITSFLAQYPNPNTRLTYFRAIKAFTTWQVAAGYAEHDPMARVAKPRTPRRHPKPCPDFTLWVVLQHPKTPPSTRAIITLLAFAGLRIHEAAKFRAEDLDLSAGTLRVLGKGGVDAMLPVHQELRTVAARMPTTGWWFPSPTRPGEPIRPNSAYLKVRSAADRAGVKLHPHAARHWHATSLLRAGVDLRKVQLLMRHASLSTTEGYLAVSEHELSAAVMRLPTLGLQL